MCPVYVLEPRAICDISFVTGYLWIILDYSVKYWITLDYSVMYLEYRANVGPCV